MLTFIHIHTLYNVVIHLTCKYVHARTHVGVPYSQTHTLPTHAPTRDSKPQNDDNSTPPNGSVGDIGDGDSSQSGQSYDTEDSESESESNEREHYHAAAEAAYDTGDARRHTDTDTGGDHIATSAARADDVRMHAPHHDAARVHDTRTSKGSGERASTSSDKQDMAHGSDGGSVSAANRRVEHADGTAGRRASGGVHRNESAHMAATPSLENSRRLSRSGRLARESGVVGQTDAGKQSQHDVSLP
jgi:hypothetical protein